MTINHVFLRVSASKFDEVRAFYKALLGPLGYEERIAPTATVVGFGSDYPYFWIEAIGAGKPNVTTHIAFNAPSSDAVDAFHAAALANGGADNGAPGIRSHYNKGNYYAAYIRDPDGNNVESVYIKK